jgi:protein phosphatase
MKIDYAYFSRKGQKDRNDDSVMPPICSGGNWWSAVADGMGGHPGGSIASATVIDAIKTSIEIRDEADISKLFLDAHERLHGAANENPELASMGTTLSLIRLFGNTGEVGHVGDSRIYHLRSDGIVDLTVDQTEVEQLVQQGVLTRARARHYPRRHVLLSVLSASREYELHRETFDIKQGDRFVLLTDGVSSKILRREIRDLSLQHSNAKSFCDALVSEVERRSPQDDYSAICLDIESL